MPRPVGQTLVGVNLMSVGVQQTSAEVQLTWAGARLMLAVLQQEGGPYAEIKRDLPVCRDPAGRRTCTIAAGPRGGAKMYGGMLTHVRILQGASPPSP